MTPERWQQIQELFHAALEHKPDERATFLDEACGGDLSLRREVESLIASSEEVGSFIEGAVQGVVQSVTSDQLTSEVGRRIGPYLLIRQIGRGGMGAVYLAERADEQYKKLVAIKLVKLGMNTDEVLRRFRHERQILANLNHPNIARLLDGGTTEDGLPYFVMEYIDGQPIDQYCDTHRLSIIERLKLFRTVCSALQYAHQNLVVHRDLKPSNILVTSEGVPKLLDFGIAKILHSELSAQTQTETTPGLRPMTPDYASPEQVRGEPITTASDVYSLGILLFELLTGRRPYQFKSYLPQEIERIISVVEPEKPSTAINRAEVTGPDSSMLRAESVSRTRDSTPEGLRRRLAGDLDNIVLMAIRKEPHRRYASVEQFSEDIRRHLEGLPVIARKDTFGYRAGKFVKRHGVGVAMSAVFLVLVIGFAVTMAVQSAQIARERDRAIAAEQLATQQRAEAERERDRAVSAEQLAELARDAEQSQRQRAEINLIRAGEAERRARAEAKRANTEAARARTEAETAKRVSEFLVGMFEDVDPRRSRGNTITAREILDKGAAKITKELKDQPKVQATLMDTMGRVYESLGLYDSAGPLLEEALKLRRQTLGEEQVEVAQSLNNLAEVLHKKSNYEAAEPLYRQALALQRKLLGQQHPDVAESLDNLAMVLVSRGNYKESEPLFHESLAMRRKLLGQEHAEVAESLNNLADLLRRKGDLAGAESLHREALVMRRKLYGNDHPEVAISLDNLGGLLGVKGDYEAAEPLMREALAIFRKLHGNDHPDVAINLNNLAGLLSAKGDYAASEPLYREALAISRKNLGEEHPGVASAMDNLAYLLHRKGDYEGAEPLYRRALEIRRKKLPKGHPDIAYSLSGLGELLFDKGSPESAEPLLREGLEIRLKTLPEGDRRTAQTKSILGGCLTALRRYDEAEPLLVEGYSILRVKRGERHKVTQEALKRLVNLYEVWGKPEKAAEYRRGN
jgi:eukaryotic-like serine/threonine-protein kinase